MSETRNLLRNTIAARHSAIEAQFREGAGGFETCARLTAVMDEALRAACDAMTEAEQSHVAVLALGGYGRMELCPKSDVDIMILCDTGERKAQADDTARSILHRLWDAGIDVGHSVRTIDDALALQGVSPDAWTSMLESRYVCGNPALADRFREALQKAVGPDPWLINGVLADMGKRHERYGNSVKLLEPNIKKSAGGLRDLHALFWLYRGTDRQHLGNGRKAQPATVTFLDHLLVDGIVDKETHKAVLDAAEFLLRLRHGMHYLTGLLHDTLEYAMQVRIADRLGYIPKSHASGVEVFMREYYAHARTIHSFSRRLSRTFRGLVEPPAHGAETRPLGSVFLRSGDVLTVLPHVDNFDKAETILEAFVLSSEHDLEPDFRLEGLIERSLDLMNPESTSSPVLAAMFRRILRSRRVGITLHQMNALGVLGRYIPEFGDLVTFFQHNVYHYFTADEHTLIAVANAEALREARGVLHDVFRTLRNKELLYMAILLHDIAKPRGVADHEITGVAMAREILERLGMSEMFPDIAFLIRHHLVMEQVAFRRNIHDAGTIREFAARFPGPEQLDELYVLTYADLSAVNVNMWTEWKASMLQDLYRNTLEVLRRNLAGADVDRYHRAKREAATAGLLERLGRDLPRENIEQHLRGVSSEAYLASFSDEEIARHIREALNEELSVLVRQYEGHTEITVVGRDAPFVLSRCCAVMAANDANIFDAGVFTRDDGVIIDRFRVSDATTRRQLDQRVCDKIASDLRQVMAGNLDIEHLFLAHRRKWKRKQGKPVNPNVRTGVEFEDAPHHTIIDVYAPDAVGFLYRITDTLSRLGLDIHFAKIATRVDGVVDAFYVMDKEGSPVNDPLRREAIREELLNTINMLSQEHLAAQQDQTDQKSQAAD